MDRYALLTQLQQEIQNHCLDIKAESLLALTMVQGVREDDFMVAFDSLFSRAYSKDVLSSVIAEDANRQNFLQFHLSRSGLHDQLPEGLFYQPSKSSPPVTHATLMAEDYQRNKQKEAETRRFFAPFENAIFRQRMLLEQEETQLLEGLQCGMLNEYFLKFWGISQTIPPALITPLIELLPYAHKIAGNLAVTAQCLEKILREQVTTRKLQAPLTRAQPDAMHQLGHLQLGMDLVIGDQFQEDFPLVEFTIGPLQHSRIQDYLAGGNKEVFLNTFYNFFLPVEAGVITRIEVAKEKKHMVLDPEEEPVLGYSSAFTI